MKPSTDLRLKRENQALRAKLQKEKADLKKALNLLDKADAWMVDGAVVEVSRLERWQAKFHKLLGCIS